jgi:hypothetical protein
MPLSKSRSTAKGRGSWTRCRGGGQVGSPQPEKRTSAATALAARVHLGRLDDGAAFIDRRLEN